MESGNGSRELARLMVAYLTSFVFGVAFVVAFAAGVDGTTALVRSSLGALGALVAGNLLAPPVVDAVLTALARDEAKRRAEQAEETDA